MKNMKIKYLVLFIMLCLVSSGCAGKTSIDSGKEQSSVNAETKQDTETTEVDNVQEETNLSVENEEVTSDVDVDLTVLSSTMVYAEVYNMMTNPEDYVGKTIKIRGLYNVAYWEETQKYYHYVIISDATACCQSGIEFIWDDNSHVYPDEYPDGNAEIEITGVFRSYEESGEIYYYLDVDAIN